MAHQHVGLAEIQALAGVGELFDTLGGVRELSGRAGELCGGVRRAAAHRRRGPRRDALSLEPDGGAWGAAAAAAGIPARPVRSRQRRGAHRTARPSAGGCGRQSRTSGWDHRHPRPRRARHHPAGVERHRARDPVCDLAGAVRRAGGPDPRRHRGGARGREPHLCASSMHAPISWRISCAGSGVGPEVRGGAVRRALARDARRAPGHPQGRRRLSAARSRLPDRAACLHAAGCRRAGAGDAVGTHRPAARARRPHRAARCRCGGDRGAADQRARADARPAQHRLCHLYVGLHRRT